MCDSNTSAGCSLILSPPLCFLCLNQFFLSLGCVPQAPFAPSPLRPTQRRWAPGTQCITKCEHTRPKPGELAFRKGDVVTILEACEVSRGPGHVWRYDLPRPGAAPTHIDPRLGSLPRRARAGTAPSTTPAGRRGCWPRARCASARPSLLTPSSASCRELRPGWDGGSEGLAMAPPTPAPPQVVPREDLWPGGGAAAAAPGGRAVPGAGVRAASWRLRAVRELRPRRHPLPRAAPRGPPHH